ncbi:TIGR03364 family FAD-dependent oxidoreductase [Noviherbaspirillum malthae]|jgi:FAD dependent oxidoreductase TIGR03364|uniref:TIGR03364 family FAD-dependent oxidoreductase n=1 Tax=Noviherbaspirillum malthae TaxID=1260987 RepID=UPI00188E5BEC|nr:TIGR03364 family FAD-dependent oxidoreductase [Noviherbaspirillum malthae]
MTRCRVAVIGAGIVGLAHARAAAMRGHEVTVYERHPMAIGASIRNFGLCLQLGQPQGELYEMAARSRAIWLETLNACGAWHKTKGSLVVARNSQEWDMLQAFQIEWGNAYGTRLLERSAIERYPVRGIGGLFSQHELSLDAREAIPLVSLWLAEHHGVRFEYGTQVNAIDLPDLHTSRGTRAADRVYLCTGQDLQTLYPEVMAPLNIRLCTLQMLRVSNPGIELGPAVLTGLSALHYASFRQSPSLLPKLERLRRHVEGHEPHLLEHGIHLIVQQVGHSGELIIGDSHHYGIGVSPFADSRVDDAILQLAEALLGMDLRVVQRWQGVYPSGPRPYETISLAPGVSATMVTSGIGMSVAFALAERMLDNDR